MQLKYYHTLPNPNGPMQISELGIHIRIIKCPRPGMVLHLCRHFIYVLFDFIPLASIYNWGKPSSLQARHSRQGGGFEEVQANPPFDLQAVHFEYPTVWKWSTSLAAMENHHCPNVSGCDYMQYASSFHGGPARNVASFPDEKLGGAWEWGYAERARKLFTPLWWRTRVITCVNKSLVQALESCPSSEVTPCTCCSANLSTFSRENSKSAGLVNAYMDS